MVKPGTLTAFMGVSGAVKTTLLDVLAQRGTLGVVTGSIFVNDAPLNASFERNTGYVQQQDYLHLETCDSSSNLCSVCCRAWVVTDHNNHPSETFYLS